MKDATVHPPLDCCGEDTCPYDYCATDADEMLESHDDLEEVLEWCLDHA
jgi:hypothetical protein